MIICFCLQLLVYSSRYTHAHHVPHTKHVESLIGQNGEARSAVETTPCCPLPIPSSGQRAKYRVKNTFHFPTYINVCLCLQLLMYIHVSERFK